MKNGRQGFTVIEYLIMLAALAAAFLLCICLGSVNIPLSDTVRVLKGALLRLPQQEGGTFASILLSVRIPRVICAALIGASLSVAGAAMQGLLRNPLADGSTMGVASGASLGAVLSIALGFTLPFLPQGSTVASAVVFAFLSLLFIMTVTYRLDASLSTNTIILVGVVFSMFISSISNLVITFAGEKVRTITFWSLGSLQSTGYYSAKILLASLILFGGCLVLHADELNAFAIGEDNARSIGINIRRCKLLVLISVSALTGICVSTAGTIGFAGLVTPHILRGLTSPNHKKLLPASIFGGAVFLMLADLAARTVLRPRELPIGVVTSLIGTLVFLIIFARTRKGEKI